MNDKSPVDYSEVPVPFVIVSVVIFLLFVIAYFLKKPEIDRGNQLIIEQNDELIKDLVSKGIINIKIFLDRDIKSKTDFGEIYWYKIDSIYVNDIEIDMDSLYRKEDFIYKNCDGNYYFTHLTIENNPVEYVFYPENKRQLNEKGDRVSRKMVNEMDSKFLPKCFDD